MRSRQHRWWMNTAKAFFGLPSSALERQKLAGEYLFLLQGLKMLPMAGFSALAGARHFGMWGGSEEVEFLAAVVLMVAIQLAYMYTSAYGMFVPAGSARPRTRLSGALMHVLPTAAMILALGLLGTCLAIDLLLSWPMSLSGLCLSFGVFAWWWMGGRFRVHYFAIGVATLLASILLPLLGIVPAEHLFADAGVTFLYTAAVLSVGGVADHVLLALYTRPQQDDEPLWSPA